MAIGLISFGGGADTTTTDASGAKSRGSNVAPPPAQHTVPLERPHLIVSAKFDSTDVHRKAKLARDAQQPADAATSLAAVGQALDKEAGSLGLERSGLLRRPSCHLESN